METHHILDRLRSAFDPLGVLSSPNSGKTSPKIAEAASILGMADMVTKNLGVLPYLGSFINAPTC